MKELDHDIYSEVEDVYIYIMKQIFENCWIFVPQSISFKSWIL